MGKSRIPVTGFRIALILVAAVILHLAITRLHYPVVRDLNDKISHILAFGCMAFLLDFSFPVRRFDSAKIVGLLAFGVLIEAIQHFLPYREASFYDVVADGIGITAYSVMAVPGLRRTPWLRLRWAAATRST